MCSCIEVPLAYKFQSNPSRCKLLLDAASRSSLLGADAGVRPRRRQPAWLGHWPHASAACIRDIIPLLPRRACTRHTQDDRQRPRWARRHACIFSTHRCQMPLLSDASADITKNQPHSLRRSAALQPAACCGLCSPATGGTGAAASGGVARAASRAARERLMAPLGAANLPRSRPLGCFSAGLLALAATGLPIGRFDGIRPGRRVPQPYATETADGTITPPHPTTHRRSPLAPPQYAPMSHDHIDPWGAGQGLSRSRTPYPRPFCNPGHSRSRTRARLQPHCPSPLLLDSALVRFSGACLSRAHPTHVHLGTARCTGDVRLSSARACEWCGRRGWCVRLSPTSAPRAPVHEHKGQAAHLIAIVNGRTYTRYSGGETPNMMGPFFDVS